MKVTLQIDDQTVCDLIGGCNLCERALHEATDQQIRNAGWQLNAMRPRAA